MTPPAGPMAPGQPPPGQPEAGTSPPHGRAMIGQLMQSLMAQKNKMPLGTADVQDTLNSQGLMTVSSGQELFKHNRLTQTRG
jgi:hypothetical protein